MQTLKNSAEDPAGSLAPTPGLDRPETNLPDGPRRWRIGTLNYTLGGLGILFFWLLWGDFAWSMKERSVSAVVQLLFKKYDASDFLTGLLIGSLPGLMTMLLGPVIGIMSDRHRGRWGRRIPYLLIPTPIIVLSLLGLAYSPQIGAWVYAVWGSKSLELNQAVLISFGLFWTLFEFATITANSVFAGLINDVVPTPVLGKFYGAFRALSLIAGMVFYFQVMGHAETQYVWIFVGIAALYGVGFTLMCAAVKEGEYPPPPPRATRNFSGFLQVAADYVRECFGNPYYRWYFSLLGLAGMAFTSVNLFSVFFAKSVSMSMDAYGKCLFVTYFISLIFSLPLGWLADRIHPLRVGLASLVLYLIVTLWGGIYARDSSTYTIALIAHGTVSGIWLTATASMGQRMLPKASFAQFCSALAIVTCLCLTLVGPLIGELLDYSGHVYRYTYLSASILTVLALGAGIILYRRFLALGGPTYYVAPE